MPAAANGAEYIAFGAMDRYFIRIVNGIRFERSDEFRFQNDLIAFRCIHWPPTATATSRPCRPSSGRHQPAGPCPSSSTRPCNPSWSAGTPTASSSTGPAPGCSPRRWICSPLSASASTSTAPVDYRVDGQLVDPASIWHVRAFTTPGNVVGLSPIAHARQAIGLGMGAEKYAAKLFGESAIPAGVITTEQAQFLGTTRANVATIARYYRVPPERIGGESGGSLTYANVEQRALDFLPFCLRRWIVTMETALSALLSSTTTVKFNAAALVRTDLLTRYQAHESAIRPGWKLRREVRELGDLPPIAGIDDQEGPAVA
jgi:hypothetical protein